MARHRIGGEGGPGPGSRVFVMLLTLAFAYVLTRAVTADEPSTVSIVIRAIGLAACLLFLADSLTQGRGHRRRHSGRRDVTGR